MSDVQLAETIFEKHQQAKTEISKTVFGQSAIVEHVLISIYSGGHTLLIGVPGLAKTLIINTVAQTLGLEFKRIQFTPDLMPSDILGSEIFDPTVREFKFIKGPIFSNIILADEINRTPPKTQSALLEVMQEKMVTISGNRFHLKPPFFVLATQNPIEQEGTYPLPEAQLDRFMFSLELEYPSYKEEVSIAKFTTNENKVVVKPIFSPEEILQIQNLVRRVPIADNVVEYIVRLVSKTRRDSPLSTPMVKEYLDWGAGPRASQSLVLASKTCALIKGKFSPDMEDVNDVAVPVLRHRILKNYKALAENISEKNIILSLIE